MKPKRRAKRIDVFFLLSMLWLAPSCKKPDVPLISVAADVKDYFNYPIGTYWLMTDSTTSQTDSFVVTDYKTTIASYSDSRVESIGITIKDIPSSGIANANTWIIGLDYGTNTTLVFRKTEGDLVFRYFLPFPYKSNLHSYLQNGITYSDCYSSMVFYSGGQTQYSSLFVRYIANRSHGFIKLVANFPGYDQTWQLAKFKRAI